MAHMPQNQTTHLPTFNPHGKYGFTTTALTAQMGKRPFGGLIHLPTFDAGDVAGLVTEYVKTIRTTSMVKEVRRVTETGELFALTTDANYR